MYWPDLQLPPINLWNAPKQENTMKVFLVEQVVKWESATVLAVFGSRGGAEAYVEYRLSLEEPDDVFYNILEETVQ